VREAIEQLNLPGVEETLLSFVGKTIAPLLAEALLTLFANA